jgi:hypothetical protein
MLLQVMIVFGALVGIAILAEYIIQKDDARRRKKEGL